MTEIDGTVEVVREAQRRATSSSVVYAITYRDDVRAPLDQARPRSQRALLVAHGEATGDRRASAGPKRRRWSRPGRGQVARTAGRVIVEGKAERLAHPLGGARRARVRGARPRRASGSRTATTCRAGQQLTEGSLNPQDILRIKGAEAVQLYLVEEVQKVYRSPGCDDQRQAHRDHRAADAAQGARRHAGRHRAAAGRAGRPLRRTRRSERASAGRGRRAGDGADRCCSA